MIKTQLNQCITETYIENVSFKKRRKPEYGPEKNLSELGREHKRLNTQPFHEHLLHVELGHV